jgi:hypothetical protein
VRLLNLLRADRMRLGGVILFPPDVVVNEVGELLDGP